MNQRQRILTYAMAPIILLTLLFVPWRVQNGYEDGYEISPYWRPVPFDEGGAVYPVLLYAEWVILAAVFAALFFCLRSRKDCKHDSRK